MSETASPGARYRIGSYRFWHRHVAILVKQARPNSTSDATAAALAHALLAPLAADLLVGIGRDALPRHRAATCAIARTVADLRVPRDPRRPAN